MLNIGRICSRDVDLADADETVHEAARRMVARRVGTLVVVDGKRKPSGIVTDRDLALRVLGEGKDPAGTFVRDVLSAPVHAVGEAATLDDAVRKMRAERCRRLAVVDPAGELVGIVSLDDVLAIMAEQLRGVASLLESEAPHALEGELQLGC
jgi:CBS domain-containing protein